MFSLLSDFSRLISLSIILIRPLELTVLTQSSGSIPSTPLEEQFGKAGLGWVGIFFYVAQSIISDSI